MAAAAAGPTVRYSGARPDVVGHPPATAALDRAAAGLPAGCTPATERADLHLVSVEWRCGKSLAAATVTIGGRLLTLSDILQGGYQGYLSSVAAAQFAVEGQPDAATTDLGTWYLTPVALAVAFPAGVVSYPLASLGPYIRNAAAI